MSVNDDQSVQLKYLHEHKSTWTLEDAGFRDRSRPDVPIFRMSDHSMQIGAYKREGYFTIDGVASHYNDFDYPAFIGSEYPQNFMAWCGTSGEVYLQALNSNFWLGTNENTLIGETDADIHFIETPTTAFKFTKA